MLDVWNKTRTKQKSAEKGRKAHLTFNPQYGASCLEEAKHFVEQ